MRILAKDAEVVARAVEAGARWNRRWLPYPALNASVARRSAAKDAGAGSERWRGLRMRAHRAEAVAQVPEFCDGTGCRRRLWRSLWSAAQVVAQPVERGAGCGGGGATCGAGRALRTWRRTRGRLAQGGTCAGFRRVRRGVGVHKGGYVS